MSDRNLVILSEVKEAKTLRDGCFVLRIVRIGLLVVLVSATLWLPVQANESISLYLGWGHWNDDVQTWIESDVLPTFKQLNPDIDVEVRYSSGDDIQQCASTPRSPISPVRSSSLAFSRS